MSRKMPNYKQTEEDDHEDDQDSDHDGDHDSDDSEGSFEEATLEGDNNDNEKGTQDNQQPHSKVSNLLANNKKTYNDMINRHTIYNIVANDLFPRIKFLDKTKDLKFSMEKGSICHYVFHLGKLSYKKNQEAVLWERAKKWIMSSIAKLRSDKCSAIRNAFYGK